MGHAIFEGTVRAENNGGFASVRTRAMDLGVKDAAAYVLQVQFDGIRFIFLLRVVVSFVGLS